MDKLYSVEDLAQACNTTPRAVRLYMKKGMLEPMRAGRTYVFTVVSVEKLNVILRCKRIGMSLDEIKGRLSATTKRDLRNIIGRIENISIDANAELENLYQQLSDLRQHDRS